MYKLRRSRLYFFLVALFFLGFEIGKQFVGVGECKAVYLACSCVDTALNLHHPEP